MQLRINKHTKYNDLLEDYKCNQKVIKHQIYNLKRDLIKTGNELKKSEEVFDSVKMDEWQVRYDNISDTLSDAILDMESVKIVLDFDTLNDKSCNAFISLMDRLPCTKANVIAVRDCESTDKLFYVHSQQELTQLYKLNMFALKKYNTTLKVSELYDYSDCHNEWTLGSVMLANKYIDGITKSIASKKLSPLESVMLLYKIVTSSYEYKIPLIDAEGELELCRTILGLVNENKYIVCSGFSTIIHAVIQELNCGVQPNLHSCYYAEPKTYLNNEQHVLNKILIKDDKYNINGTYYIDATSDSKTQLRPSGCGFASFMRTWQDLVADKSLIYLHKEMEETKFEKLICNVNSDVLEYKGKIPTKIHCNKNISALKLVSPEQIINKWVEKSTIKSHQKDLTKPLTFEQFSNAYQTIAKLPEFEHLFNLEEDIKNSKTNARKIYNRKAVHCLSKDNIDIIKDNVVDTNVNISKVDFGGEPCLMVNKK